MNYSHTQFGYVAPIVLVLLGVWFAVIGSLTDLDSSGLVLFGLVVLLIAVVVINFNRLTITIEAESETVEAAFGWGWPRKQIAIDEITSVDTVKNKWWYGYGVRKIPHGWMFNVWGQDAVEVRRASGRPFRFGTDEPVELAAAISAAVERQTSRG
ncbi:MAG: hypothetical protein ACR2P0_11355 [Acidimicrobiales bacterium]